MLDHVTIGVTNLPRARAFYDAALAPLGIAGRYAEGEDFAGYGANDIAVFWIGLRPSVTTGTHIAFTAKEIAPRLIGSMKPPLPPAGGITASLAYARTIMTTITVPSSWTRTAITSKPCATTP